MHLIASKIQVGTKTLLQEFEKLLTKDHNKKTHDTLLDELKYTIFESVTKEHQWDTKAIDSLVIEINLCNLTKNYLSILKLSYFMETLFIATFRPMRWPSSGDFHLKKIGALLIFF